MMWIRYVLLVVVGLFQGSDVRGDDQSFARTEPLPRHVRARLGTIQFRHGSEVLSLRFIEDGKSVVSFGMDESIRVWDVSTGLQRCQFEPGNLQGPWNAYGFATRSGVLLSPDGRTVVACSNTANEVVETVWDLAGGKRLYERRLKSSFVMHQALPAFSPDGKILAFPAMDRMDQAAIRLVKTRTGKLIRELVVSPPGDARVTISSLGFTSGGSLLVVKGQDLGKGARAKHFCWIHNLSTSKTHASLPASAANQPTCFARDGNTAVIITAEGKPLVRRLHLWDVIHGKIIRNLSGPIPRNNGDTMFPIFSPDGKSVASVLSGQFRLCEVETGKALPVPNVPIPGVRSVAFSPDSKRLAICCHDGQVVQWERSAGKNLRVLKMPLPSFELHLPKACYSPDGGLLATAVGSSGNITLWNTATSKQQFPSSGGHWSPIGAVATSPNGQWLASSSTDGVLLWNMKSGKEHRSFVPLADPMDKGFVAFGLGTPMVPTIAITDSTLAIGDWQGHIRLIDPATGKQRRLLKSQPTGMPTLAFTPDGKTLVSGCITGQAQWWQVESGKLVRTLGEPKPESPPVFGGLGAAGMNFKWVFISPDGRLLAITRNVPGGYVGQIKLVEMATGKVRRTIDTPDDVASGFELPGSSSSDSPLPSMVFSTSSLMALCKSQTIHLMEVASGKEIRQFGVPESLTQPPVFSPDGKLMAAVDSQRRVRLWETATGTILADLKGHRGGAASAVFSPDGQTLITGGSDSTILLWDIKKILTDRRATAIPHPLDLWQQLAAEDAQQADQAIMGLVAQPQVAVTLFKRNLRPIPSVKKAGIKRLIAGLEDNSFEVRTRAFKELEKLGEIAGPLLSECLSGKPSLEVRRRIELLLEKQAGGMVTGAEQIRGIRAVEVLEHIGTPEAKDILRRVAQGEPAARLTQDARAALQRLN